MSLRILVSGMVAGDPQQGGATWAVLQYVLGLRRLGHDVVLVEPVAQEALAAAVPYFRHVVARFDLESRAALLVEGSDTTAGLPLPALRRLADGADLLINVSGMLRDPRFTDAVERRVYLDLDPAFNQLWHELDGIDMGFDGHERFVTVGLALGTPGCPVPTCGLDWVTTTQPVVLDHWPVVDPAPDGPVTTVGNWRAYGSIEWNGAQLGQKAHSWRELLGLPARTSERLVVALAIHPAEVDDIARLDEGGWTIADPAAVAGTPDDYADFVRGSKAELGIAKSGYVASRCGWFSDRSACYLASGRPVVAQDTGFADHLPTGEGLLAFSTAEDAATALAVVAGDLQTHAAAARGLAEEAFDSDRVLGRLLEEVS